MHQFHCMHLLCCVHWHFCMRASVGLNMQCCKARFVNEQRKAQIFRGSCLSAFRLLYVAEAAQKDACPPLDSYLYKDTWGEQLLQHSRGRVVVGSITPPTLAPLQPRHRSASYAQVSDDPQFVLPSTLLRKWIFQSFVSFFMQLHIKYVLRA